MKTKIKKQPPMRLQKRSTITGFVLTTGPLGRDKLVEVLRNERLFLDLTQTEVAARAGCSPKTISGMECGRTQHWRFGTVLGYATAVDFQVVMTSTRV